MNRRDLISSLAAVPSVRAFRQDQEPEAEPWRFELDGRFRWSLHGPGRAVVDGAEIRIGLADGVSATLADLSGARRLRSGSRRLAMWTVVGRFEGLEISALFVDGAEPRVSVRVRGLDEPRALDVIHFTDGVSVGQTSAFINGYQSWSPCQVVPVTGATDATSHWHMALMGASDLGLLFGEDDAGAGEFQLRGRRLDALARFRGRLIGAVHPPAVATLAILPAADPLEALGAAAGERAGVSPGAPATGWRSSFAFFEPSEAQLLEALEQVRTRLDPRAFRYFQLDDGYQKAAGDWETNTRFPGGHAALTEKIRAAGFEPSLWLAPFAATGIAGIAAECPEWLVRGPNGEPLVLDQQPRWGGAVYALDASLRAVQDWLRSLARQAVQDWGYARLAFDHLHLAAAGERRPRGASPEEAARAGFRALKEGAARANVSFGGVPLQAALGRADSVRVGDHIRANGDGVRIAAPGLLLRAHLAGQAWSSDAGAVLAADSLSLDETRVWASIVALTGSVTMSSELPSSLGAERLEVLQRIAPAVALRPRVLDIQPSRGGDPPSWLLAQPTPEWWMVAGINWSNEPRRLTINLDGRGVRGAFAAFDCWSLERLPDVRGPLGATVPAHGVRVVALRRARAYPFVIGTSRHLVQGAVDLASESWDRDARTLSGKSVMLDGRPYRVTIAVPAGFRAQACTAGADCVMAQERNVVTLDFAAGRDDVEWQVSF